jgi:hypothetical protein
LPQTHWGTPVDMEQAALEPHCRLAQFCCSSFWQPVYGFPAKPLSQAQRLGEAYSQWLLGPHRGLQTGGPTGGMHSSCGSPMNPSRQMQVFVSELQCAFSPHVLPPQASTQRPDSQTWLRPGHGLLTEQTTGEQLPPGKGFPIIPSWQTQTGPS